MSRPMLPWKHQNSKIKDRKSPLKNIVRIKSLNRSTCFDLAVLAKDLPPVKYQLLDRDGQQVLVSLTLTIA